MSEQKVNLIRGVTPEGMQNALSKKADMVHRHDYTHLDGVTTNPNTQKGGILVTPVTIDDSPLSSQKYTDDKVRALFDASITDVKKNSKTANKLVRTDDSGRISISHTPTSLYDAVNKNYVDNKETTLISNSLTSLSGTSSQANKLLKSDSEGKFTINYNPVKNTDIVNKKYVDDTTLDIRNAVSKVSTDTDKGKLVRIDNNGWVYSYNVPTNDNHIVNKKYVDDSVKTINRNTTEIIGNNHSGKIVKVSSDGKIRSIEVPTNLEDVTNKLYVDSAIRSAGSSSTSRGSNTLVKTDSNGELVVKNPSSTYSVANKNYVDSSLNNLRTSMNNDRTGGAGRTNLVFYGCLSDGKKVPSYEHFYAENNGYCMVEQIKEGLFTVHYSIDLNSQLKPWNEVALEHNHRVGRADVIQYNSVTSVRLIVEYNGWFLSPVEQIIAATDRPVGNGGLRLVPGSFWYSVNDTGYMAPSFGISLRDLEGNNRQVIYGSFSCIAKGTKVSSTVLRHFFPTSPGNRRMNSYYIDRGERKLKWYDNSRKNWYDVT